MNSTATRAGHTPAWRGFVLVRMRHRRYFLKEAFSTSKGHFVLLASPLCALCADVVHHSPKLRMFSNLCRSLYAPHRSTVAHSSTNWLVAIGRGPHQQDSKNLFIQWPPPFRIGTTEVLASHAVCVQSSCSVTGSIRFLDVLCVLWPMSLVPVVNSSSPHPLV